MSNLFQSNTTSECDGMMEHSDRACNGVCFAKLFKLQMIAHSTSGPTPGELSFDSITSIKEACYHNCNRSYLSKSRLLSDKFR